MPQIDNIHYPSSQIPIDLQDILNTTSINLNISTMPSNQNQSVSLSYDKELAKIEVIIQATIIAVTVLGNGIVLWTLFQQRKKLTRMHLFILHLALADLFVALFNTLPMMVWDITHVFLGGDALCRIVTYLQSVAIYASSYVLVATAVDRYFAICHPLSSHRWSNKRVHLMVVIAWFFSFLFSLPQVVIWGRRSSGGIYNCLAKFEPQWTLQFYITWLTAVIYILPTISLTLFYGMICYTVWKRGHGTKVNGLKTTTHFRNRAFLSNRVSSRVGQNHLTRGFSQDDVTGQGVNYSRGLSRAKVRSVALTLTVVACYFVCWSPFFICQMWAAWDETAPFTGVPYTIIMLLVSLNSCTNPWIYMFFSVFQKRKKTRRSLDGETTTVMVTSSKSESRLMSMKKRMEETSS